MSAREEKNVSFWDHLDELRSVIFRAAGVYILAVVVLFFFMPAIFNNIILWPTRPDFPVYTLFHRLGAIAPSLAEESFLSPMNGVELVNIELASQFMIHISCSCWMALVVTLPIIIYLCWTFIKPALYPQERAHSTMAFLGGNLMFYCGVAAGYFCIFPLTLRFLSDYQLSPLVPNIVSLTSYMDTFVSLLLMMGLVFEIPLLAWLLGKTGLLTHSFFTRYRRHAIVVLLILAAVITPTGDPFTLFAAFIPIYLLWEASALLVKKN